MLKVLFTYMILSYSFALSESDKSEKENIKSSTLINRGYVSTHDI